MAYVILLVLMVLSLLFVFRKRVVRYLDALLKLLFVAAIGLVVSAMFTPQFYESAVDQGLQNAGTYGLIVQIDDTLEIVQSIPGNVLEGLQGLFGAEQQQESNGVSPGLLESTLYTGLVLGISGIVRAAIIAIGIVLLIILTYVQYSIGGAADIARLERRVKDLESRIAEMQASAVLS